jgi:hypothetical protein
MVVLLCLFAATGPSLADLVLWNKLGSETDVLNSEVGPDFTIIPGASIAYETVMFDGGITATAEDTVSKIHVPTDMLFPGSKNRGTLEFWAKFLVDSDDPESYMRGVIGNQNHNYPYYTTIIFGFKPYIWVQYGDAHVAVQSIAAPWIHAGDIVHFAVSWDKDGIDGSADICRVYVDGVLAETSTIGATWDQPPEPEFYVLSHTGGHYHSFDNIVIDNIKIYDHAKTDFSDRFNESPLLETVPLDIKPGSCPNPLNLGSRGVIPAAILGTGNFDIGQIDTASIRLEGVAPIRSSLEDVATPVWPFTGKEDCVLDCDEGGPDGFTDLTLKFKTQQIVAALGDLEDGFCRVMTLTGNLKEEFGGTEIVGEDVVIIKLRGGGGVKLGEPRTSIRKSRTIVDDDEQEAEDLQLRR